MYTSIAYIHNRFLKRAPAQRVLLNLAWSLQPFIRWNLFKARLRCMGLHADWSRPRGLGGCLPAPHHRLAAMGP